jgi:hypothetical protein
LEKKSLKFEKRTLPSLKELSDFSPFVSVPLMGLKYHLLFLSSDGILIDIRIEVIVPSKSLFLKLVKRGWHQVSDYIPLSALLPGPPAYFEVIFQLLCNESPPLGAILLDESHDGVILL